MPINHGSIQALREARNDISRKANNLLADKGDKLWSPEDQKAFDGFADEMERLDKQILSVQKMLDVQAQKSFADAPVLDDNKAKNESRKLYAKVLAQGVHSLNAEERMKIQNTMSTTTTTEGGYTVQSEVASELISAVKDYSGMRMVAGSIQTGSGNPLSYPTSDGTAEEGEWIGENTTATDLDITFGTVGLNVFKASSKVITIPFELLQDSQIDIVGLINQRFADRIGRTMNKGFTIGTGTGQPNGCVTASSVGKTGTTGQTLTVIYDDLVDLIDSIDVGYDDGSLKFMFGQPIRKVLRKIKDTAGRPIWTPSYDAGISNRSPDQLLGYDTQLNNHMPVPAANAKSIAFGQFKKYVIRDVMQLTLFRFDDSAFAKKGQVGFLAWMRAGGNLVDVSALKLYQHSAT